MEGAELQNLQISTAQRCQPREKADGQLSPLLLAILHRARLHCPSTVMQVTISSHFWTTGEKPQAEGISQRFRADRGATVWVKCTQRLGEKSVHEP